MMRRSVMSHQQRKYRLCKLIHDRGHWL